MYTCRIIAYLQNNRTAKKSAVSSCDRKDNPAQSTRQAQHSTSRFKISLLHRDHKEVDGKQQPAVGCLVAAEPTALASLAKPYFRRCQGTNHMTGQRHYLANHHIPHHMHGPVGAPPAFFLVMSL